MRTEFLPFALPSIGESEIQEVVDTLRSGWITTGPKVARFEAQFAEYTGARFAIAVNSGTAGMHVILAALNLGPGDEVIVPTMTFCSTAHVVAQLGARPVLVDVDANGLISVDAAAAAITPRTRAIMPVHYAGQACNLDEILALARRHGLAVVEDAAHAAGCEYGGCKIGTHGSAVSFSFYATKNLTTGEGGMITTDDEALARRMRLFTLHGMSRDAWKRYTETGSWYYEVLEAGFKYNMMDIQAALGIHQLRQLAAFTSRRQKIARQYTEGLADLPGLALPKALPNRNHVYHLYPIHLGPGAVTDRASFIKGLSEARIGSSVHFIPVHRHPFYRDKYGYRPEQFPVAEKLYAGLVSLPIYPAMSDSSVEDVIGAVRSLLAGRLTASSLSYE